MSIAALGRIGAPVALRGITKLIGRKGRKRARAAAAAQPGIVSRALALAQRVAPGVVGRISPVTGRPMRRRARGISGTEIRGFKKVSRLLSQFGMRPRGLARPMARGRRPFSRARFGDPDAGDIGFDE